MTIRNDSRCLVGVLALVLLVPGCKKPNANTSTSSQQGGTTSTTLSAPDPGGTVQNVRGAVLRVEVESDLRQFAQEYRTYTDDNSKPPTSLMDLPEKVKHDYPKLVKKITDGDIIVIWNLDSRRLELSNTVFAYVAKATPQGRLVAFLDGHVSNMSEADFAKATKGGM